MSKLHADLRACNTRIFSDGINLSSYLFPCLVREVEEGEVLKVYTLGGLLWAQETHKEVFSLSSPFTSCFWTKWRSCSDPTCQISQPLPKNLVRSALGWEKGELVHQFCCVWDSLCDRSCKVVPGFKENILMFCVNVSMFNDF